MKPVQSSASRFSKSRCPSRSHSRASLPESTASRFRATSPEISWRHDLKTVSSAASIDAFYAVYLTGAQSPGFALVALRQGRVIGSDVFGVSFSGSYDADAYESTAATGSD